MFSLKKDWLYSAKIMYGCFVIIQIFLLLLGIISKGQDFALITIGEVNQTLSQLSIIFIMIYPVYVLKMISPRRSNFFDAPLLTANLPYTKKQLWWNGIKHWFYLAPLYLIVQLGINYYLQVVQLGEAPEVFLNTIVFNHLVLILVMIALVLQCLAAIIRFLAFDLKWYSLIPLIIGGNLIYLFISIDLFEYLNSEQTFLQLLWIPIPLILISIPLFLTNLKHIEKIWR